MTDIVPHDEIEAIVGVNRHPWQHWAKAVSAEQKVYILHSQGCLDDITSSDPTQQRDLRDCPYSLALDLGIDLDDWAEDVPLRVTVGKAYGEWILYPVPDAEAAT